MGASRFGHSTQIGFAKKKGACVPKHPPPPRTGAGGNASSAEAMPAMSISAAPSSPCRAAAVAVMMEARTREATAAARMSAARCGERDVPRTWGGG